MTEAEILVMGASYIRIWEAPGCMEMNDAYNIQKYIPNSLAIGDDEGGKVILYASDQNGYGLYQVGFSDLDINDAEFISPSLTELLIYELALIIFYKYRTRLLNQNYGYMIAYGESRYKNLESYLVAYLNDDISACSESWRAK